MRLSASSILRISLRSRSRVRSSRLNSSSWVARSFGSGKLAASSFMCETVRSTSTMRSRFQLLRMLRKCSSCSLLMYSSPRLTMYGCTLRGPASRLPGSTASPSSTSGPAADGAPRGRRRAAGAGRGRARPAGAAACAASAPVRGGRRAAGAAARGRCGVLAGVRGYRARAARVTLAGEYLSDRGPARRLLALGGLRRGSLGRHQWLLSTASAP